MVHSDTRSQDQSPGAASEQADAGERAEAVRQRAQRTAERVAEDARHQTTETVSRQKRAAADQIGGLASALRKTAEQLKEQQQGGLARYTDSVAEDVDRMAAQLRDKDVDELIRQTQAFARRRPDVFLGGAVATGFLLARFLKSSDRRKPTGAVRTSSAAPSSSPPVAGPGSAPSTGGSAYSAAPTSTTGEVERDGYGN